MFTASFYLIELSIGLVTLFSMSCVFVFEKSQSWTETVKRKPCISNYTSVFFFKKEKI